jgi:hypothetical protein
LYPNTRWRAVSFFNFGDRSPSNVRSREPLPPPRVAAFTTL